MDLIECEAEMSKRDAIMEPTILNTLRRCARSPRPNPNPEQAPGLTPPDGGRHSGPDGIYSSEHTPPAPAVPSFRLCVHPVRIHPGDGGSYGLRMHEKRCWLG